MKIKKLKKQITFTNKFVIRHTFNEDAYVDYNNNMTSNIKDAMYFSSYNEAEKTRKSLFYAKYYEVVIIHEN